MLYYKSVKLIFCFGLELLPSVYFKSLYKFMSLLNILYQDEFLHKGFYIIIFFFYIVVIIIIIVMSYKF